jgi:transposase
MLTKNKQLNFQDQKVYVGIDTHLTNWRVTIMLDQITHKTFSQDPDSIILAQYLKRNFPGGEYLSAYEAGFCGYSVHRALIKQGIQNIIVNPADIPTTDKERKQKEDKRDSRKIARSLRNGELEAIHVPSLATEELRGIVRYRKTLVKEIARNKTRIKSFLHLHGIKIPTELNTASRYWSSNFSKWLGTIRLTTSYGHTVLINTLDLVNHLRSTLLKVNRELKEITKSVEYQHKVKLLTSIPGVGLIVAMTLISELESIERFKSLDKLCSYIGLVPTTRSSSDKERIGGITPRSNKPLRSVLIESAWIATRNDPALALTYSLLCKRMKPNRAIIRIAKKLLSRIRYVLKNELEYECAIA